MTLQERILALIKEEIAKDPENRGYAGKTDLEITTLLNSPYYVQTITETLKTSRISSILAGVPNTENVVAEKDVLDSKTAKSLDELGVV
jgi:hypothetical protein